MSIDVRFADDVEPMIRIVVRPAKLDRDGRPVYGHKGLRYATFVDGQVICPSVRFPFFDTARALQQRGVPDHTMVGMYHEGSDVLCLKSTVSEAVKVTVRETDKVGPIIVPYEEFSLTGDDQGSPN